MPPLVSLSKYQTVAASTTAELKKVKGAVGDHLLGVLVVPSSLNPGAITIKDGSGSNVTIFAGGTASITTLHPFYIPLGIRSTGGGWSITTNADASVICSGNFS